MSRTITLNQSPRIESLMKEFPLCFMLLSAIALRIDDNMTATIDIESIGMTQEAYDTAKELLIKWRMIEDIDGAIVLKDNLVFNVHIKQSPVVAEVVQPDMAIIDKMFDELWDVYDNKVGKFEAKRSFVKKIKYFPDKYAKIIASAKKDAEMRRSGKKEYVNNLSKWLDNYMYDDECYDSKIGSKKIMPGRV